MRYIMMLLILVGGYANAHQWTPTYPSLSLSHVAGVMKVQMEMFNGRKDVNWYEVSVHDKDGNPIKFSVGSTSKIFEVPYLKKQTVDIYFRSKDASRVEYICSKSKIVSTNKRVTIVSSRICSKLK